MRILVFTGGLGNQMFEYAFYKHLKSCFPMERFYGHYGVKLKEHYGLEINKWFDVTLPPEKWWTLPTVGLYYIYKKLVPNSKWLDLFQREWKHKDAKVFFPFKFTKVYFPRENGWLKWKVDEVFLCEKNKQLLQVIHEEETCFVHVRRGDYLSAHLHSSVGEYLSPDTAEPIHKELYIDNPMELCSEVFDLRVEGFSRSIS